MTSNPPIPTTVVWDERREAGTHVAKRYLVIVRCRCDIKDTMDMCRMKHIDGESMSDDDALSYFMNRNNAWLE